LVAGNGDDVVIGGGGADVLRGGAGDDVLAVSDITLSDLLTISDESNTLRVLGDETDTVDVAEGFVADGTVVDGGVTFDVFVSGQAILEIEENVSVI